MRGVKLESETAEEREVSPLAMIADMMNLVDRVDGSECMVRCEACAVVDC
jgi:hypothetical protein